MPATLVSSAPPMYAGAGVSGVDTLPMSHIRIELGMPLTCRVLF